MKFSLFTLMVMSTLLLSGGNRPCSVKVSSVKLMQSLKFPLVINGKNIGEYQIVKGTELPVMGIKGEKVLVMHRKVNHAIAREFTDYDHRQDQLMQRFADNSGRIETATPSQSSPVKRKKPKVRLGLIRIDREMTKGSERYILKVPITILGDVDSVSINVTVLSKLSGKQTSFGYFYRYTRTYYGYAVGKQIEDVNVRQSMSNPITEFTISASPYNMQISGYYVELVVDEKRVDSKLWEKRSDVINLKRKNNLPDNWWTLIKKQ